MSSLLDAAMWDLEIQGKTAVCVALDGVVRGVLGLADTAKPEAYSTLRALAMLGIDVWMVSECRACSLPEMHLDFGVWAERLQINIFASRRILHQFDVFY